MVRFEDVTKVFGHRTVVDRLTLAVEPGEFVVILGPSGCGKSTSLRILAGLERATSGSVYLGPELINDLPPQRRDVAMVFQNYALYPHMTVAENIGYPLRVRKLAPTEIAESVNKAAEMLEIRALLVRRPRELSGGERQRVALARAIVRQPRAFLMDEPLSNLDAKLRVQMRAEVKRLQHELGTTTLYVTHDQAEAMTLAHRVAVMRNGKLQQFDTPMQIYDRPANRFVAEFVGSPSMNVIEGRVDRGEGTFASGALNVELEPGQLSRCDGAERVAMGIRPEHLHVSADPADDGLAATVHVTELMGNETFVFLKVGDQKLVARAPATFRAQMDDPVRVSFDIGRAHFFDSDTGVSLERDDASR